MILEISLNEYGSRTFLPKCRETVLFSSPTWKTIFVAVLENATGLKSSGCCEASIRPRPNLRPSRRILSTGEPASNESLCASVKDHKTAQGRRPECFHVSNEIPK